MPLQGFSQDLPLLTLRRENLCLPSAKGDDANIPGEDDDV